MTSKVKICGITNVEDALFSQACGAEFLGLIFVAESPRYLEMSQAKEIVESLEHKTPVVGVFRNSPIEDVEKAAHLLALDYVQLHGTESPEYCRQIGVPVIKSFTVSTSLNLSTIESYRDAITYALFDRAKEGNNDDYLSDLSKFLESLPGHMPSYFVAGNLNDMNVVEIVQAFNPFAVDVASGVEISPGKKDAEKVRAFCDAVRGSKVK